MTEEKMDKDRADGTEHERVVLVDDLADAGDYWLSITDAARVTRRQEITIRRWISAGALPVRRQRMGANKRTRHVRASDLGMLTPIIDPLAAITGAPANADLMSIPLQQAHLLTTQQDFAQRLDDTAHSLAVLVTHVEQERQMQELHQHTALDGLRQEILSVLHTLEERVGHQDNQILLQVHEHQVAAEHANREMSQHLAQETVVREEANREQRRMLTTLAAQISQIEGVLTNAQARTEQMQMEIERRGEETEARWHRQQHEAIDQLRTQMIADMQQFVTSVNLQWHQHLEDLSTSLQHHLTDVEQRCGHAEGELVRLRRQQRPARRSRRAAST